jgi:hypothetical protein
MIVLFAAGLLLLLAGRARNRHNTFVAATTLLFLWLAADTSIPLLLPRLPVHWYRAFELFLLFFGAGAVLALAVMVQMVPVPRHRPLAPLFLSLALLIRLFSWDPVAHEEYRTMNLTRMLEDDSDVAALRSHLKTLEPGSMILGEVTAKRGRFGSPHWLDVLIQEAGHRNAGGLTVESSLTPMLSHAYLSQGLGHLFVWGIDPNWETRLFEGVAPTDGRRLRAMAAYLKRAGVSYLIAESEVMRRALEGFPGEFKRIFESGYLSVHEVVGAKPGASLPGTKPWGFLDLRALRGQGLTGREMYADFLLFAGQTRLRMRQEPATIVNLSPIVAMGEVPTSAVNAIEGLILFNADPTPAASHVATRLVNPLLERDLPLLLVNFRPPYPDGTLAITTRGPAVPLEQEAPRGTEVRLERFDGERVLAEIPASSAKIVELALSYFPVWKGGPGDVILQTDTNQMLVVTANPKLDLRYHAPLARITTTLLYVLLMVLAVLCIKRMRIPWLTD